MEPTKIDRRGGWRGAVWWLCACLLPCFAQAGCDVHVSEPDPQQDTRPPRRTQPGDPLYLKRESLELPVTAVSRAPSLARLGWGDRGTAATALWVDVRGDAARISVTAWERGAFQEALPTPHGREWDLHDYDPPALARSADVAVLAWTIHHPKRAFGSNFVRLAVTSDGGLSWDEPRLLHDDRASVEHVFPTVIALGQASDESASRADFVAAWLCGCSDTNRAEARPGEMHLHARCVRATGEVGPELLVDGRVSEACAPQLVGVGADECLLVYRGRTEDEVRDIRCARLRVEGQELIQLDARVLEPDGWRIEGCPQSSPRSACEGENVLIAWYTEGVGQAPAGEDAVLGPRVQVALSVDGGHSFTDAQSIDAGSPGSALDVAALPDGSFVVAWQEYASLDGEPRWLVRRLGLHETSETQGAVRIAQGPIMDLGGTGPGHQSGLLRMGSTPAGVICLWPSTTGRSLSGVLLKPATQP